MKYLRNFFSFFVYSNLFIAGCAVLMAGQTSCWLLNQQPNIYFTGFVFFSTLCSYSFHWYLTADTVIPSVRVQWLKKNRIVHVVLFFTGLAGAVFFFFYLSAHWGWLLLAALVTFLYSAPKIPHPYFRALRKVALGKTIFLAFVWMYVTTILPIIISGPAWDGGMTLFAVYRFFQVYAICILFDFRDREDDKSAGVRSLITYMNEKNITWLFTGSLAVCFVTALMILTYGYTIINIVFLLVPCIITGLVYNYARRNFTDMFYYFTLDGLMALSALLMLVARI